MGPARRAGAGLAAVLPILVLAAPAPDELPSFGHWRGEVAIDALDDSPIHRYLLAAEQAIEGTFQPSQVMLVLECSAGEMQAAINTGTVLDPGEDLRGRRQTFRLRRDSASPETLSWPISRRFDGLSSPEPGAFAESLIGVDRLLLELTPLGRERQVVSFPTTGAGDALAALRSACGWRPPAVVTDPVPVEQPQAEYTARARAARIRGVAILRLSVDARGAVTEVEVVKGLPMGLTEEAVAAARRWTFQPATRDGQPIAGIYVAHLEFRLP